MINIALHLVTLQFTGHNTGYCLIKMTEADVVSVKDHVQLCFGKELNTCTCCAIAILYMVARLQFIN